MYKITAVLTSYNRKEKTLMCLEAFFSEARSSGAMLEAVLLDDGSCDGTADAVRSAFAPVTVCLGDSTLYWSRGMNRAQMVAMAGNPDFILWLNDDTTIKQGALTVLLATYLTQKDFARGEVVVVGATGDSFSGDTTYGGLVAKSRMRPFAYIRLAVAALPMECEAMNGNIVLVPRAIYQSIGSLDPVFEHALGDIDYALRARNAGFRVFVAPGIQGYCSPNMPTGTHLDPALPARERWIRFKGRKGLPVISWRHFLKRHAGWLWPLYFVWPYIKFAFQLARDSVFRRSASA